MQEESTKSKSPLHAKQFNRPNDCLVLHKDIENCVCCRKFVVMQDRQKISQSKHLNTPARPNAPLSNTHPYRVKLALQQERLKQENFAAGKT